MLMAFIALIIRLVLLKQFSVTVDKNFITIPTDDTIAFQMNFTVILFQLYYCYSLDKYINMNVVIKDQKSLNICTIRSFYCKLYNTI